MSASDNTQPSSNGGPALSVRPAPIADRKPKNLAEFIARVNAQPGGFRALDADQIRTEIEARKGQREDDNAIESSSSDEEDDDEDAPKDLNAIRMEVLKNIE